MKSLKIAALVAMLLGLSGCAAMMMGGGGGQSYPPDCSDEQGETDERCEE